VAVEPKPNIAQIKIMAAELAPKLGNKTYLDNFIAEPITVMDSLDPNALKGLNQIQLNALKTYIQDESTVAFLKETFLESEPTEISWNCWICIIGVIIILVVIIAVFVGNGRLPAIIANSIVQYNAAISLASAMTFLDTFDNLNDNSINGIAHWVCTLACP
jgi:hypothetical protein